MKVKVLHWRSALAILKKYFGEFVKFTETSLNIKTPLKYPDIFMEKRIRQKQCLFISLQSQENWMLPLLQGSYYL